MTTALLPMFFNFCLWPVLTTLAFGQEANSPPRSDLADATELPKVAHPNMPIAKVLRTDPIAGTVDGKAMSASLIEVTFAPGDSSPPHYHPGEVVGYVAQGTLEFKIAKKPLRTLKAGDTFFEPSMIRHEVARNPDAKRTCRVIITMIHPKGAKRLTIPAQEIDAREAGRSDE